MRNHNVEENKEKKRNEYEEAENKKIFETDRVRRKIITLPTVTQNAD